MVQETLGWDDVRGVTYSQRSKEEAHDYRYFPEPDLPPLEISRAWVEEIRTRMPELPDAKHARFVADYGLTSQDARILVGDRAVADYFRERGQGLSRRAGVRRKVADRGTVLSDLPFSM